MLAYHRRTTLARRYGFVFMIIGTFLMMVLVVSFNGKVGKKEEKVKQPMRYIKTEKQPPKSSKPKPKPKPKQQKATPKAPMPDIGAMLGGIAMDIPEFAPDGIEGDASRILGEAEADAAMSEGSVDSKPTVLSRTPMEYPASAAQKKISGYVIVNLLVDKDGSVETAQVVGSNPPGVFDAVALRGVQEWKFTPAKYKGNPVKVWAKQKIRFDLN